MDESVSMHLEFLLCFCGISQNTVMLILCNFLHRQTRSLPQLSRNRAANANPQLNKCMQTVCLHNQFFLQFLQFLHTNIHTSLHENIQAKYTHRGSAHRSFHSSDHRKTSICNTIELRFDNPSSMFNYVVRLSAHPSPTRQREYLHLYRLHFRLSIVLHEMLTHARDMLRI